MKQIRDTLEKIFSKETLAKATELIVQADVVMPGEDNADARHLMVVDGLVEFVERMDDQVSRIPHIGFLLKAIIDSPPIDEYERKACAAVVELAYQTLRLEPNQAGQ